jgi:hypothetical protein
VQTGSRPPGIVVLATVTANSNTAVGTHPDSRPNDADRSPIWCEENTPATPALASPDPEDASKPRTLPAEEVDRLFESFDTRCVHRLVTLNARQF